ncbi:hypothetical protein [Parashewanella curva]|uniref:hypothetical protein n=1 Tax=Parashewanella curva TaxID=2338552 RepID=UPI001059F72B|nr:hypothetical protein [Parashewanella curva]
MDSCFKVSVSVHDQLSIQEISIKTFFVEIKTQGKAINSSSMGDDKSTKFTLYKVIFFDSRLTPRNRAIELAGMPIRKAQAYVIRLSKREMIRTFIAMFQLAGNTVSGSGELQISDNVAMDQERRELEDTLDKIDAEFSCYQEIKRKLKNMVGVEAESQLAQCRNEFAEALSKRRRPSDQKQRNRTTRLNQIPDAPNRAESNVAYLLMLSEDERTLERLGKYRVHSELTEEQAEGILTSIQQEFKDQRHSLVERLKQLRLPAKAVEFNGRLLLDCIWYNYTESYEDILKLILQTSDFLPYLDFFCGSKYMYGSLTGALAKANTSDKFTVEFLTSKSQPFQHQAIEKFALTNEGICRIVNLVDYLVRQSSNGLMTDKLRLLLSVIGRWINAEQESDSTRTFLRNSPASEESSEPNEQVNIAAKRESNEQIIVTLKESFDATDSSSSQNCTDETIEVFEWVLNTPVQKVLYKVSPEGFALLKPYIK